MATAESLFLFDTDEPPAEAMPANPLLQVRRVYAEPAALESPRGRQVLGRLPGVEVVEVASHWQIPELHGDERLVERWVRVKTETLVLGVRKGLPTRPNGRSANFIAPGPADGCAMACAYCYVLRRKGFADPITVFTKQITAHLRRHVARQGPKTEPDQCDPTSWVYDIGENGDCSVDVLVSDNVADLVATFRGRRRRPPSPPSTSIAGCWSSTPPAAPASGSGSCPATTPGCSTCGRAGSTTASPRSTTSSRPGTRCT